MRRALTGAMVALGALAPSFALGGAALAAAPVPITVASSPVDRAPAVLVDSRGTVNVLWDAETASGYYTFRYARKPAGASSFSQVALPGIPQLSGDLPFIYEPSPGTLEIIVDASLVVYGWRSTNDGVSWSTIDATGLDALRSAGILISSSALTDAPGGPIAYAGDTGALGPIVQLPADLTGATTLEDVAEAFIGTQVAESAGGTVFVLGASDGGGSIALPFQAGSNTGVVAFPCTAGAATLGTAQALVAGRSDAVVAFSGCGHVWTRTISPTGALGPVLAAGRSPVSGASAGTQSDSRPWVQEAVDPGGGLTLAYTVPGGDVGVAQSADGSRWTLARGLVPVAQSGGGAGGTLASGNATWLGSAVGTGGRYAIRLFPLSDTYLPPRAPSGKGIPRPSHGTFGSLAVTVPGGISARSFDKRGKATVRLVDALADKVSVSIGVDRVRGNTTYDLCSGGASTRLRPGVAKTVTLTCTGGGSVIGAESRARLASGSSHYKRGDRVTFSFGCRNGTLAVTTKLR